MERACIYIDNSVVFTSTCALANINGSVYFYPLNSRSQISCSGVNLPSAIIFLCNVIVLTIQNVRYMEIFGIDFNLCQFVGSGTKGGTIYAKSSEIVIKSSSFSNSQVSLCFLFALLAVTNWRSNVLRGKFVKSFQRKIFLQ